jgi:hypothetical protein
MKGHEQRIEADIPGQAGLDRNPTSSRLQNDEVAFRYQEPSSCVRMNLDKGTGSSRV